MKTIPIFFAFDNNYVIPASVAFFSLLKKAKKNIFYDMYVIHSDIPIQGQKLLSNIVKLYGKAHLTFIDGQDFLKKEWKNGNFAGHNEKTQFTADSLICCFASKFFPNFDTIIYSDVDVVFMDDISELAEIELKNCYCAGVKNAFMKYLPTELAHLSQAHYEMLKNSYIATGILVLNLKKIREDNLEQKMLQIIKNDAIIKKWPDQDVLNIACEKKVRFLPLNYIAYPYMQDLLAKEDFISHYTEEELFDSILNPKIIHYASVKPWNKKTRYSDIWYAIFNYLSHAKYSNKPI